MMCGSRDKFGIEWAADFSRPVAVVSAFLWISGSKIGGDPADATLASAIAARMHRFRTSCMTIDGDMLFDLGARAALETIYREVFAEREGSLSAEVEHSQPYMQHIVAPADWLSEFLVVLAVRKPRALVAAAPFAAFQPDGNLPTAPHEVILPVKRLVAYLTECGQAVLRISSGAS